MLLYLPVVAKSWESLSHSMARGGCAAHAPLAYDSWNARRGQPTLLILPERAAVL